MWKNYLKTSLRFFARNKGFSLLNLAGLCAGTLCCVYILLYVRDQYSYDRDFPDASNIYRVVGRIQARNGSFDFRATTSPPVGPALASEFPVRATRMIPMLGSQETLLFNPGENIGIYVKQVYFVDANFSDVFPFRHNGGRDEFDPNREDEVILSKNAAIQLFGPDDPLGKKISIENNYGDFTYTVIGIADEDDKSSIYADAFLKMSTRVPGANFFTDDHWLDHTFAYTFVKLTPDITAANLEEKLPTFLSNHTGGQLGGRSGVSQLSLQPFSSIHTTGGYEQEMTKTVDGYFLALLFGIASLIQLIACINFMNLATARASRRAKEVGVRKIIGAGTKGLMTQFLAESVILALVAVLIALPVLAIVMPWLNKATGADISRTVFFQPGIWLLLVILALVTGLLAGSYPAFYLTAFQAPRVLKGDFTSHVSARGIRRTLVVFQFVLSIILIAGMLIIRQQLDYIQNKDLGFNKDEQIVLSFHRWKEKRCANYFAMAMLQIPEVSSTSLSSNYPGAPSFQTEGVYMNGSSPTGAIAVRTLTSDEHFLATMGIRLLSGNDFHLNDTSSVIINEALMRQLNLDYSSAVGSGLFTTDRDSFRIVGVMKDFNFQSLHETVAPLMLRYSNAPATINNLILSVHAMSYSSLLAKLDTIWRRRVWVAPFTPRFLSDEVKLLYDTEIVLSRIVNCFTLIAILISCMGLFGLAAFDAEQRTKEIGIRKVMGASVSGIVALLSGGFFRLIGLASLVAIPVAWWIMHRWLQYFAYHIDPAWWAFGIAGGSAIAVAMTVVVYQARKAAVINPVKSLRAD